MISSVIRSSPFYVDCINFFDDIGAVRCIGVIADASDAKS